MNMRRIIPLYTLCISTLLILLSGCSSQPTFDTQQVTLKLTPQQLLDNPSTHYGKTVLWGGTILQTHNLTDYTQIEVLAYPLGSYQRPLTDQPPQGRFLVQHKGYLEPAVYTQGRLFTVMGKLHKTESGQVGEHSYNYPVIQSEQVHLWPVKSESSSRIQFGIGIGIHN
jgi:outer membrane lipoprotein